MTGIFLEKGFDKDGNIRTRRISSRIAEQTTDQGVGKLMRDLAIVEWKSVGDEIMTEVNLVHYEKAFMKRHSLE